ncbi:MAG: hypothetical protein J2P20_07070 [Pseudonocardia sp.]|nr:hypothetical protein [Pseudonocardia sp.]
MSTTTTDVPSGRAQISARTLRTDRWWLPPLLTVIGLAAWVIYATVRVFMQKWYWVPEHHYLTPFYSPCVSAGCDPDAALFGRFLPNWPILPFGAISLPFLLLFRLSCYYYRKAYYRGFWRSPPACAVAEPHKRYSGETRSPLLWQNVHRYFFYIAFLISIVNTVDAILAFRGTDGGFGIGLGTVILWANVLLLWAYTLSCHSCRSIMGGRLNHFSKHPVRYWAWTKISKMNAKHQELAWTTLGTLAVADFYVMAVAAGWFADPRILN